MLRVPPLPFAWSTKHPACDSSGLHTAAALPKWRCACAVSPAGSRPAHLRVLGIVGLQQPVLGEGDGGRLAAPHLPRRRAPARGACGVRRWAPELPGSWGYT